MRLVMFAVFLCSAAAGVRGADPRDIRTGSVIPDEGYCDQPYVVVTKQGHWLCTFTTGPGREGQSGQHVVASISTDHGRTWSEPPIDIEPAEGPEASWAMPLATPYGRVYAFYVYNGDRIHVLGGKKHIRADTLGWYVYRYSDDGGRTWSDDRHRLPVRVTACDRANDWQGKVQMFWGIGEPIVADGSVLFGFTKLERYPLTNGEGWFFRSDNILGEREVSRIEWTMLPEGEHGLRADRFGSIQEEHNLVALPDGDLYCIYRTTTGYPCHSYSRDGGRTWTTPEQATYSPGGRRIKNPRACARLWRTSNGKYLLWFHNHSGTDFKARNPAWLAGGEVRDGVMHWSQPEIVLYDPDPAARISYPDLIEQDGRYWITETQKQIARVHEIDASLLEGMWQQDRSAAPTTGGVVLDLGPEVERGQSVVLPPLPGLGNGGGFTLSLCFTLDRLDAGQVILDSRDEAGKGFAVTTTKNGTIYIDLNDGRHASGWDCDPGLLDAGRQHHVTIIIDGGPKIISFVVDGVLCDGGEHRQYGWGRFNPDLDDVNGSGRLRIGPDMQGTVHSLRVYDRYLRTSEAVANHQAR